MPKLTRSLGLSAIIGLGVVAALALLFDTPAPRAPETSYTEFLKLETTFRSVVISGDEVVARDGQWRRFTAVLPADPAIATRLAERGVEVTIVSTQVRPGWATVPATWGPTLVYLLVLVMPLYRIARAVEAAGPRRRPESPRK